MYIRHTGRTKWFANGAPSASYEKGGCEYNAMDEESSDEDDDESEEETVTHELDGVTGVTRELYEQRARSSPGFAQSVLERARSSYADSPRVSARMAEYAAAPMLQATSSAAVEGDAEVRRQEMEALREKLARLQS